MDKTTTIYERLEERLYVISQGSESTLEQTRLSYQAVEASMQELKAFISTYVFKDVKEEIYFFKEIKPLFYSRLIYYIRLFEIESNQPKGSIKAQRKYLKKQLAEFTRNIKENSAFYKYYRSGANYMDEQYFVRDKFDIFIGLDVTYFDCDTVFCTSHDYKLASLLANEMVSEYLSRSMNMLAPLDEAAMAPLLNELSLNWAETKSALIELIYGLQSLGVFYDTKNNVKADVKQVANFFEVAFNVKLGNFYRTFQEIRIRKKGRTSFLDRLRQKLIERMDETDDDPR